MSKHETPMIRAYWHQIGGTLVEEFMAIPRADGQGRRLVDAVILPNWETRIALTREVSLEGEEVIVVQAKAKRLGMYLMGQTLFSLELIKRYHRPATVRSVALCARDDTVLRPILEEFDGVEVVVQRI